MARSPKGDNMRAELELAIFRLQKGRPRIIPKEGAKLNISNVAKEVGVTPASIHNNYPDISEQIRSLMGKSTRAQRDEKHDELQQEKKTSRNLRGEVLLLEKQLTALVSENARLLSENAELKAIVSSKNVTPLNRLLQ